MSPGSICTYVQCCRPLHQPTCPKVEGAEIHRDDLVEIVQELILCAILSSTGLAVYMFGSRREILCPIALPLCLQKDL